MRPLAAASSLLCLAFGCARVPALPTGLRPQKLLKVTFTVRGQIQPLDAAVPYYYFVLIQRTDDPNSSDGPAPVVSGPQWGNGFAAPSKDGGQGFVGFVSYGYQGLDYRYWSCRVGGQLLNPTTGVFTNLGRPLDSVVPARGSNTLSFTVNLNDIDDPTLPITTATPRYVILNIVATSAIPQGAVDVPKLWDALGDGKNNATLISPVVIDTNSNITRRNSDTVPIVEPSEGGDVRDRLNGTVDEPNLDITDWRVDVVNG